MPIAAIIEQTHARFWYLPDVIAVRRQQRRSYMRRYMREVYRKTHVTRNITLSTEENRRLLKAAAAYGRKPAALLRQSAFAYLEQRSVLPKSAEAALAAFTLEVRRVGTNINQLAHQANIDPRTAPAAFRRAAVLLGKLEAAPARYFADLTVPAAHGDQITQLA